MKIGKPHNCKERQKQTMTSAITKKGNTIKSRAKEAFGTLDLVGDKE